MKCNPRSLGRIFYKSSPTEFEIQAEIYHLLRQAGIQVRGEVTAKHFWRGMIRRCKFDLIVFRKNKPAVIIETKKWGHTTANQGILVDHSSRQVDKYRTFGLPIIHCGHIQNAGAVLAAVHGILEP